MVETLLFPVVMDTTDRKSTVYHVKLFINDLSN